MADTQTVCVTLDVEVEAAMVLSDERTRAAMGRLVSRVLHPRPSALGKAIEDAKAAARAGGLTDADIDAEPETYNAERRGARKVWSSSTRPPS